MSPDLRTATAAEFRAAYTTHSRTLRALGRELGLEPSVADELIRDVMSAALVRRSDVDLAKWLAAAFRAAAKRYSEPGK